MLKSVAALAAFSLSASPALACQESQSRLVHVGDVNFASDVGAQEVLARFDSAAHIVCFGAPSFSGNATDKETVRLHCEREAVAGAVTALNASSVTALYSARLQ